MQMGTRFYDTIAQYCQRIVRTILKVLEVSNLKDA